MLDDKDEFKKDVIPWHLAVPIPGSETGWRLDDTDEFGPFWISIENPHLRALAKKHYDVGR